MKQLFGTPDGRVAIKEMPIPALRGEGAIVQPKYSAISIGTEGTMLRERRAGVADSHTTKGFDVAIATMARGKRKKTGSSAKDLVLGYSNVGVVLETNAGLASFIRGDTVTCAGIGFASHAQQCYVPKNLLARCPANVDLREAAFTTLGACAMQGLRRGRVELGETVAVIGLGMLGQLAVQMAKVAGAHVVAVDVNDARLKLAAQAGADVVAQASNATQAALDATQKRGVDVAIITAGNPSSSAPLVQALEMIRDRGRVVVVGNVKCEFPRDAWFYKDAELLIARSYGPGRYDPQYEDQGHDYPLGYVRWTEGRNLQEFVRLLSAGQVKVAPLITHEFPFERAPEAYELLLAKPNECLGVLLKY
ncbi:MAG: zinc-binding alcohol dehydrogenase [Verrucomicrobia bacterium]|nr:zinc-binding alcohol dehydrogenase [Verrucomicrobiota bacterium]